MLLGGGGVTCACIHAHACCCFLRQCESAIQMPEVEIMCMHELENFHSNNIFAIAPTLCPP